MKSSTLLPFALALTASLQADLIPTAFARLARDSGEVRALYGATVFANPASRVGIQVAEPGVLRFTTDTLRSEGTVGFSTKVGFLLPVAYRVEPRNLTGLASIRFDLKLSEIPSGGVRVSIRSNGYGGTYDQEGKTYEILLLPSILPQPGTWKTFSLVIEDFLPPASWTPEADFPDLDSILKVPEGLLFSPLTLYRGEGTVDGRACSRCVDPTTTRLEMEIRGVRLVGHLNPDGLVPSQSAEGCPIGFSSLLDDFKDGDSTNRFGGIWSVRTDTSSDPTRAQDSARGTTRAGIEIQGDPDPNGEGFLRLHAALKKSATREGDWRPYAGWAQLSTDFESGGELRADALSGISFQAVLPSAGPHLWKLLFKVQTPGVPLDRLHQVEIALPYLDRGSAFFQTSLCVRPQDLQQPYWVADRKPFHPSRVQKLIWEVSLADNSDPMVASDSVELLLSDIQLHRDVLSVRRKNNPATIPVFYKAGRLSVDVPWARSEVLVVAPSGRIAARFTGKVQGERLSLERGAWKVLVRDPQGRTLVRPIVVMP